MNYVVGDVHGCFDDLNMLLDKIETKDPDPVIYFVGDFIDRGPKVPEVMKWVAENISMDGKYRSVRGNHDWEAYEWYYNQYIPWVKSGRNGSIPKTYYDFDERVLQDFGDEPERIRPFMDTVEHQMDFNKKIDVVSAGGVPVTYRLCHAGHSYDDSMSIEEQRGMNLYYRNYWGNHGDEIVIHGHTPTIVMDYQLRVPLDENRPGLIGYHQNDINVDGGCCFFTGNTGYPCMLCAICLETFEEIYPYTVEERIKEGVRIDVERQIKSIFGGIEGLTPENLEEELFSSRLTEFREIKENQYRREMMESLGLR